MQEPPPKKNLIKARVTAKVGLACRYGLYKERTSVRLIFRLGLLPLRLAVSQRVAEIELRVE